MAGVRMQDKLEVCIKDWAELADEYKQLELAHKEYRNVSPTQSLNLWISTIFWIYCPLSTMYTFISTRT